jgi:hypothetical protein
MPNVSLPFQSGVCSFSKRGKYRIWELESSRGGIISLGLPFRDNPKLNPEYPYSSFVLIGEAAGEGVK